MMKSFCVVSAFLLLLLAFLPTFSYANASVEEVCQKATEGSEYYDYCISTLKSVPISGDMGLEGLAAIATELSKDNYNANMDKIEEMMKKGDLPEVSTKALQACAKVYELGISKLQQAANRLQMKDFNGASNYLSTARDEAVSCLDTFTKLGIPSLMQNENDEALKISYLAIHISKYLL